jgi:hypothetical protein
MSFILSLQNLPAHTHKQTLHAHRVRRANFNFISRSERRFQNGLIICVWPLMWWGFGELMGPPWAVPIKKRAVCMWVREHRQIQISVVAQPRESRISASRCVPACAPQLRVERLPRAQFARARERESNCRAGLSPLTWYEAEKSWPDYPIHDVISVILQVLSSPICSKQNNHLITNWKRQFYRK